jgi:hypothetical protein
MSRWKKLNDWPDYLQRMSVSELREELATWNRMLDGLGHRDARKEAENRIRRVRRVLDERLEQQRAGSQEPRTEDDRA